MLWNIKLLDSAAKQLKKLDPQVSKKIAAFIDDRLLKLSNPRQLGQALTGEYQGFWRYRIGDYRILCDIQDEFLTILVVDVGHRKEVYKK